MAHVSLGRALRQYWVRTGYRVYLTRALDQVLPGISGLVLDVGGGREALHDKAWRPTVRRLRIDISSRHAPDALADATALPIRARTCDAVVMTELLEHLPDPGRALDEAYRVLKAEGQIIGSVPFMMEVHGDPADYFRYTSKGLRHLLRRFVSVQVIPIGNRYGAVWQMLSARSRALRILNPMLRNLGRTPETSCPQGYVFRGKKVRGRTEESETGDERSRGPR